MNQKNTVNLFETVSGLADQCAEIITDFKSVPELFNSSCSKYQDLCRNLPDQLKTGRLKIAVVGVIKSGKSTFVNALIGKEMVQRGAGAMTSITTRIRKGSRNRAVISFKSWDQVNSHIENALKLFPLGEDMDPLPDRFDLRRKADRTLLRQIYDRMLSSFPMADGYIMPETLVVRHALDGFEQCRHYVEADEQTLFCDAEEFDRHRQFTTDADFAFYVNDVLLEVDGDGIAPGIEIADCQGSDSTDPSAIGQVLNYIQNADLIIYCISSRNGLRQSDLVFLEKIRGLGLLDQVIIINNCDFSEHDNLGDLKKIESGVRRDLEIFKEDLSIFSFSCLYRLFHTQRESLSEKQAVRLRLWDGEIQMVEYANDQFANFMEHFNALDHHRNEFLARVHLSRLKTILSNLESRLAQFAETLDADQLKKEQVRRKYENFHEAAVQLESIVNNSIDAAIKGILTDVEKNLDRSFSDARQELINQTHRFIDQLQFDVTPYRRISGDSSINKILYLLFHDFRRSLDVYSAENVMPVIQKIVAEQERTAMAHFTTLLKSYQLDFFEPGVEITPDSITKSALLNDSYHLPETIDFEKIKELLGISVPGQVFRAQYSTATRARVLVQFIFTTVSGIFSSAVDKKNKFSFTPGLKQADLKIKQYTKSRVYPQIQEYQQKLLQHYLLPLIESAVREFKSILAARFEEYKSLKSQTDQLLELQAGEKQTHKNVVSNLKQRVEKTNRMINELPF